MNALAPFGDPVNTESTSNELSVFKDPFQQSCIDEITIKYRKPLFCERHVWQATVDFKNGLTTGTQKTPDSETWDQLMIHLKQIYQSLNVKPQ